MAFKSERQHPKDCAKDREALKKELLDWVNSDWQQKQISDVAPDDHCHDFTELNAAFRALL
jgi:hypothetical protein